MSQRDLSWRSTKRTSVRTKQTSEAPSALKSAWDKISIRQYIVMHTSTFELKHVAHWNDGTQESFIQCLITRHSAKTKCSVSYSVKSDIMIYRYMTVNVSIIAEPLYRDTIIIIGNEL